MRGEEEGAGEKGIYRREFTYGWRGGKGERLEEKGEKKN